MNYLAVFLCPQCGGRFVRAMDGQASCEACLREAGASEQQKTKTENQT